MGILQSFRKFFSGAPYILVMTPGQDAVHIILKRGDKALTHQDTLSQSRSLPLPFVEFLKTQPNLTSQGYAVSFPIAQRLAQSLRPLQTEGFQLDSQAIEQLKMTPCPQDFGLTWRYDSRQQTLIRELKGTSGHLGEGWFFRDFRVWQVDVPLQAKMVAWISQPTIDGRDIYQFLIAGLNSHHSAHFRCDLQIEEQFTATVKISNMLKQAIDLQIISNKPELAKQLQPLRHDPQHLISNNTLIPYWQSRLSGALIDFARSGQATRIQGETMLALLKDHILPHADALGVDIAALQKAYPILDAARVPVKWRLEHEVVQGIGRYQAVPGLMVSTELLPVSKLLRYVEKGTRFLNFGGQWLEFTPAFHTRVAEWQQKRVSTIQLMAPEIMGASPDRLAHVKLQAPSIVVPQAKTEREDALMLIETMRQNGLPVGLYGLQQETTEILATTCLTLFKENPKASILWLAPRRKKDAVVGALKTLRVSQTARIAETGGKVFVASPEEAALIQSKVWTLIVFSDLDTLASGDNQSKAYGLLRRLWSISTFTKQDWHRDQTRAHRVLQALGLYDGTLHAFLKTCTRSYTDQSEGFLTRLVSPFKKVFTTSETVSDESRGIPIPPRQAATPTPPAIQPLAPRPTPIPPTENVYRPTFTISTSSTSSHQEERGFLGQAKKYVNRTEAKTEMIPFMQYWPTYDSMTHAQKKWYFYWRSQVRQGQYLPTDLSYLFIHIYEILHLVGVQNAEAGFEHLVTLWREYRPLHPKLDGYLIDWIADFHVVYQRSGTAMVWYARVLQDGGRIANLDLALEAWLTSEKEIIDIPDPLLNLISDYAPAKSKFYQQYNNDGSIEHALRDGLRLIDGLLKQKKDQTLLETHRSPDAQAMRRRPFAGALYEGKSDEITIATVPHWADSLRAEITAILKYTENLLRRQKNFKGTLRGIDIPKEWAAVLEKAFPAPSTAASAKRGKKAAESQETAISAIAIDFERVQALVSESEAVRSRLTVDEETGSPVELNNPVIETSVDIPINSDVTVAAIDSLSVEPSTRPERPDNTPDHLLTDLQAVANVMSQDETSIQLLRALQTAGWNALLVDIEATLEGSFINVIIDRINERAIDLLGDYLIFIEADRLVVAEDYHDELEHLLTQPQHVVVTATAAAGYTDLTAEWSEFVHQMKPHHWEALNALLIGEDVSVRLEGIARSAYTTANLLVDEINEFALSSIGDIVIETDGIPTIEEEDLESLRSLMEWALIHVIQE